MNQFVMRNGSKILRSVGELVFAIILKFEIVILNGAVFCLLTDVPAGDISYTDPISLEYYHNSHMLINSKGESIYCTANLDSWTTITVK